jgi:hypothetical protein
MSLMGLRQVGEVRSLMGLQKGGEVRRLMGLQQGGKLEYAQSRTATPHRLQTHSLLQ